MSAVREAAALCLVRLAARREDQARASDLLRDVCRGRVGASADDEGGRLTSVNEKAFARNGKTEMTRASQPPRGRTGQRDVIDGEGGALTCAFNEPWMGKHPKCEAWAAEQIHAYENPRLF